MTWFRKDDKWPMHRKARAAGRLGRELWDMVGPIVGASASSNGVVSLGDLELGITLVGMSEDEAKQAVIKLVASGLWHSRAALPKCAKCLELGIRLSAGEHYFHDWTDYNFGDEEASDPIKRDKELRNRRLKKDSVLRRAIQDRDRGLCRYCGCRTNQLDRRGPTAFTYDHVDPEGGNTLENVVTACRRCNGLKRDRTPGEAGMTLLPPPDQGPDLGPTQVGAGS